MRDGWEIKKLGEVCEAYQPRTISGDMLVENGEYLVYGANGIIGRYNEYNHTDSEILLTCRGATCGCINVSRPYSWINGNAMVVRPLDASIIKSFLRLYLKSVNWSDVITGAAQPQITRQSLTPLTILIPPISEQERIVEELDLLSGIIEKKRQQLKELDNLAQSIFYEMFGDPINNKKGWEVKKLSTICKNLDSNRRPITATDREKGEIPYYGASGIVDYVKDYIFDGDYLLVSEDGANLIMRSTPIAFPIQGKTWVNNHAHVLKFINKETQKFVEYYINSLDISDLVTGCAQPKLTQANMNNINVFYPPLSLQQQFAEKVEAIEKQKLMLKQSIEEAETLFNSRMDYYFN